MEKHIDPQWEFDCDDVIDFHQPLDSDADDWFDVDRENEPPLYQQKNRTAFEKLKHAIPSIKSPLKDVNAELSYRPSKPVVRTSGQFRKKSPENSRHFHLKTKMTAGRQLEKKRRSIGTLTHHLSTTSISSKTSQNSKATENEEKEKTFVESLRRYDSPDPTKKPAHLCTIPVPFSFESRMVEKKTPVIEFKSFAQQVISYQNKTPLRFRTKPKVSSVNSTATSLDSHQSVKKVCVPKSPSLQTMSRTRPSVQSQKEIEEQEYEKMKSYKFQAQPFKEEIFRKGYKNLPEKRKKDSTTAKPFSLHVNVPMRAPHCNGDGDNFKFRAKPVNTEIFKRPLGIPNVPKAGPVPVKPFYFDELDVERQRKKEQKIQAYWEQERRMREFRANPLPDLEQVKGVPEKQPKPKTVIEPFDFLKSERELHTLEKKRLAEEQRRLNEPFVFKAKPLANLSPFIPQKPNRYLECDAAPNLLSDKRALQRKEFERELAEKEERRIRELEERRRYAEAMEEEEVKKIRDSIVHKAQPIRHYRPVERPPTKELTEPTTPITLKRK